MNLFYKHFYLFFFVANIFAECSDLDYSTCIQYPEYCTWDDDNSYCYDNGGYGTGGDSGGGAGDGPYEFSLLTESQGLRNGPDYRDGIMYKGINVENRVVPGWGRTWNFGVTYRF